MSLSFFSHLLYPLLQEYKLFRLSILSSTFFHLIYLFLIFLWEGFSVWASLSPFPCNVSGVDFNSIIGFLVYMRYFFSFVFFTLFYAFPVDLFCSRGLHRLFHRELFSAIALWTPIPRSFLHDAGVFLSGMCARPLRFQSFLSLVQQSLLGPRLDFSLIHF